MQRENTYIEIIPQRETKSAFRTRHLKVAAYCRVSTEEEQQQSSYEAQIEYYTDKIMRNPEWELAGIYADDGITGTSIKRRDDFNQLIADCENEKIDMILTKSISRFARNTVDCISTIRRLKELNISVLFEKENINTGQMGSEMILTLLSAFAQAESESISANVAWGKRHAFKSGKVPYNYHHLFGYEKGKDDKPKIVEAEAEIVRRIYREYLNGLSLTAIRRALEAEGIKNREEIISWPEPRLQSILKNEKYVGDALLQKTFTADCISKKVKVNNGELPKYYIRNAHEAIVERDIYNKVQEEMARRASKRKVSVKTKTEQGKYSGKYALSEKLRCSKCGSRYRRVTWNIHGRRQIVWRCISRLDYGMKYCEDSPSIHEEELHSAIVRTINKACGNMDSVISAVSENITRAISSEDNFESIYAMKARIKELTEEQSDWLKVIGSGRVVPPNFDERMKALTDEKFTLQERIKEVESQRTACENEQRRLSCILTDFNGMAEKELNTYSDVTVRKLIDEITVIDKETISVLFKGGIEIKEKLR